MVERIQVGHGIWVVDHEGGLGTEGYVPTQPLSRQERDAIGGFKGSPRAAAAMAIQATPPEMQQPQFDAGAQAAGPERPEA